MVSVCVEVSFHFFLFPRSTVFQYGPRHRNALSLTIWFQRQTLSFMVFVSCILPYLNSYSTTLFLPKYTLFLQIANSSLEDFRAEMGPNTRQAWWLSGKHKTERRLFCLAVVLNTKDIRYCRSLCDTIISGLVNLLPWHLDPFLALLLGYFGFNGYPEMVDATLPTLLPVHHMRDERSDQKTLVK